MSEARVGRVALVGGAEGMVGAEDVKDRRDVAKSWTDEYSAESVVGLDFRGILRGLGDGGFDCKVSSGLASSEDSFNGGTIDAKGVHR
jgi:hypothetical protein